jgi:hypothetical protein
MALGMLGAGIAAAAKGFLSGQIGEFRQNVKDWREKRQQKKEDRQAKRAGKTDAVIENVTKAAAAPVPGTGNVVGGGSGTGSTPPPDKTPGDGVKGWLKGEMIKGVPNWLVLGAGFLLLGGGKWLQTLMKPKRRAPRRRSKPKTVVRYRTRRAPARRRKR